MRKSGLADSPLFSVHQEQQGSAAPLSDRSSTEKAQTKAQIQKVRTPEKPSNHESSTLSAFQLEQRRPATIEQPGESSRKTTKKVV